jgi:tripartite-type tricarboxylate transporter receptor subunit TctC
MPPIVRRRRQLLALAAALAAPAAAGAQTAGAQAPQAPGAWPERPVRVIVPFPPGSTPDVAARAVAGHFARVFGQPFVVENRAGAGGTIGTDAIAKAADGHTIGVSINAPVATAKALYPRLPYDPARDLAPVSLLVRAPQLLVVPAASEARDAAGFVALAKARPGALSYGSTGTGSASHLAMEALQGQHGLTLTHVPYRGFPQASLDLLAGRIDVMFAIAAAVLGQVREGRMRALGVTAAERFVRAPEIPTLAEGGLPGLESYAWIGLIAPSSTPAPLVDRLSAEARRALAEEGTRTALERAGFEVMATTPAAFRDFIAAETREWGGLIERLGIRAEA